MYGPSDEQMIFGMVFLVMCGAIGMALLMWAWPYIGMAAHWIVNLIW